MKHIISLICFAFALTCNAQTAMNVLDRASAEFKKCQSVNIEFEIAVGSDRDKGNILLQGSKFRTKLSNTTTWFDGKTMWSFVKDNEEVNVTQPTVTQTAKMNPYAFLNIYKNGYNVAFGGNTKTYYEVILTANGTKSSIKKAIIRVAKNTYQPLYVMMGSSKGDYEINILSYKKGKKQADSAFRFNKKQYPKAEIIDLR